MGEPVIPENVGHYLSDRLALLQERVEVWQSYYTGTVTLSNVVYWLLQFGELKRVQVAFRLLEHLHFLTEEMLSNLLSGAIRAVPGEWQNDLLFCPIGKPYDSAGHISYAFSKHLGLPEEKLNRMWTHVEGLAQACRERAPSAIIFIDDNITSGIQFRQFLRELLTETVGEREHITQPLPAEDIARIQELPLRLAVAVDLAPKEGFAARIGEEFQLADFDLVAGRRDYGSAFDFGSALWRTAYEAAFARATVAEIAAHLYADKRWDEKKVQDRLLGFGNLGKLIVFPHNIPKSLVPVFWKFGQYGGRNWFPLFPERGEWQRYSREIQEREPYMDFFAGLVSAGSFGVAAPVCTVSLAGPESTDTGTTATITSEGFQQGIVTLLTKGLKPLKHQHSASDTMSAMGFKTSIASFNEPPASEYERYNAEVDEYNTQIQRYGEQVERVVKQVTEAFVLTFRIRNRGTAPATEVRLQLELASGIDYIEEMPALPYRPKEPSPPRRNLDFITRPTFSGSVPAFSPTVLQQISDQLAATAEGGRTQLVRDGERRYVVILLRKVLQHTFEEIHLRYLVATGGEGLYHLPFQLITEQATQPIQGVFDVQVVRTDLLQPEAYTVIARDIEEEDEE